MSIPTTTPIAPPASLQIVAVSTQIVREVRHTMKDAFGHVLHLEKTQAPCRHCLRIPQTPEDMILMSYRVLPDRGPYAEVGPIFVHAAECEPYRDVSTFPGDFLERALVLRAYTVDGEIADAVVAVPGDGPRCAAAFLNDPSIAEVHVRHISYTCFDFAIVRGSEPAGGRALE
jgi:hypothetical protein